MQIKLPKHAENIIKTLEDAGFEAYAVGGCVRDSMLGREPDDWDITTSARPEQVKKLFCRTVDTGIQHGTVTVLFGRESYEVTTYRIDGEYEDGRHPKGVVFTGSLKDDLCRRDFTINAMAYHPREGLVDCFDGMGDLSKGRIRCVGNARERFTEDALRMMRAVRFAAQLSFSIEEDTFAAIQLLAGNLAKVSAERIQVELIKLLCSPNPDQMRELYRTGLSAVFFPEFDACMKTEQKTPHHCYTVGEHILHSLPGVRADKCMRLAMLFHDIAKPETKTTDERGIDHFHGHAALSEEMAKKIMRRLKLDTDTIVRVSRLVRNHDRDIEPNKRCMRRAMASIGADLFPDLFDIKEADMNAQSGYQQKEKRDRLARMREVYAEVAAARECVSLKELAVSGRDLIGEGIAPGPELGNILSDLLELVLEDPTRNTKEYLLGRIRGKDS